MQVGWELAVVRLLLPVLFPVVICFFLLPVSSVSRTSVVRLLHVFSCSHLTDVLRHHVALVLSATCERKFSQSAQ